MFCAPHSARVTSGDAEPTRVRTQHGSPAGIAYLLVAVLLAFSSYGWPQDGAMSFSDTAAQAAAARDRQDVPTAIRLYDRATQLKPDWTEGWWYLGLLQYTTDQYAGAIVAFDHLMQLVPTAVPAMALRGLCEFETGAYDDSLRDLETSVAHGAANEPRNEQIIRFHLAQLLTRASRFQEALDQYKHLAEQGAEDAGVLQGIGLAGLRVPKLVKEVAMPDRALLQEAGEAGEMSLGGHSEEADRRFSDLFERYPQTAGLHYFYGFLLFPHDPPLAVGEFRKEVAVAPGNQEAQAMLAFTLMIAGRYAEALPEAQKAYATTPDSETVQLALGRSLAETGDVKRGTDLLNEVLKKDPDSVEAHLGLASIYSRTGRREDADRERMACLKLAK